MIDEQIRHIICVTGCPRSGLGLAGAVIGARDDSVIISDPQLVERWLSQFSVHPRQADRILRQAIRVSARSYLDLESRVQTSSDAESGLSPKITRLVLVSPALAFNLERLQHLNRPVSVVWMMRDPRAVVASMTKRMHGDALDRWMTELQTHVRDYKAALPRSETKKPDGVDLDAYVWLWTHFARYVKDLEKQDSNVAIVRYEDLVESSVRAAHLLEKAAQVTPDAAMATHHRTYAPRIGFRLSDFSRSVEKASVAEWMARLSPAETEFVLQATKAERAQHGYTNVASLRPEPWVPELPTDNGPVIIFGRGHSGTRLFAEISGRSGLFLGNRLNESWDSIEWVQILYEILLGKLAGDVPTKLQTVKWHALLRRRAADLTRNAQDVRWGFKLPEAVLTLDELYEAFPNARFVHILRHPISTSLGRPHVTSFPGHVVGRAVLQASYRWAGIPISRINEDNPDTLNAYAWAFQVSRATRFAARVSGPANRVLNLRYEDLCKYPRATQKKLLAFIGSPPAANTLCNIDPQRDTDHWRTDPAKRDRAETVWSICKEEAEDYGYSF